jgi:hypothetical protein
MSWLQKLHAMRVEQAERSADPWGKKVEDAVRGKEAISTVALFDILGVPKTTANARRIAKTMRSLGYIAIKSRRFMPGGFRDTVARGWARPVRELGCGTNPTQGGKVQRVHLNTPMHGATG